jgi:hypothetical protein
MECICAGTIVLFLTYIFIKVCFIASRTCSLMKLDFTAIVLVLVTCFLVQIEHVICLEWQVPFVKRLCKKIWHVAHTMFFGSGQWTTNALHCSSVSLATGEVVLIWFAGTPLKYFAFSRYRYCRCMERIISVTASLTCGCSSSTAKRI